MQDNTGCQYHIGGTLWNYPAPSLASDGGSLSTIHSAHSFRQPRFMNYISWLLNSPTVIHAMGRLFFHLWFQPKSKYPARNMVSCEQSWGSPGGPISPPTRHGECREERRLPGRLVLTFDGDLDAPAREDKLDLFRRGYSLIKPLLKSALFMAPAYTSSFHEHLTLLYEPINDCPLLSIYLGPLALHHVYYMVIALGFTG